MPPFIPGLKLSQMFFEEAVRPILAQHAPRLRDAAALIGPGSEVLGFSDPMSTDHHRGPRLMLFIADDQAHHSNKLDDILRQHLPQDFHGWPTNFAQPSAPGPANHGVEIQTLPTFINSYLSVDLDILLNNQLTPADWLSFPSQKLLSLTAGAVYHDAGGQLTELRRKLNYYPHDVWLYLLAAGWTRIAQEEHIAPRAGHVRDDLGSRLIAARLVGDMMNLCLLINRQYPPYSKWLGSAFAQLSCAPELTPIFHQAVTAPDWKSRELSLCQAYTTLARMHNALKITEPLSEQPSPFHERPFMVINAERFAATILGQIRRDTLRALAAKIPIGAVWQFSTSADLLENARLRSAIARLYDPWV